VDRRFLPHLPVFRKCCSAIEIAFPSVCLCPSVCDAFELRINRELLEESIKHRLIGQRSGSVVKQVALLSQRGRTMLHVCQ